MNYPAHARFDFCRDGRANRRDRDAEPRVLLLGHVIEPGTGDFAGIVIHEAGDTYTRQVERHAITASLIEGMEPLQAFALGRLVEGGEPVAADG